MPPAFHMTFENAKYRFRVNLTYMKVIQIIFNELDITYVFYNSHLNPPTLFLMLLYNLNIHFQLSQLLLLSYKCNLLIKYYLQIQNKH